MIFAISHNRIFFLWLFFISLVDGAIDTSDGDEFSNNLFSDLAPLLALFGEQFAKQYMSQSTNWLESVVFAMAPLGIVTAVVSAIRVAGPPWLRALVGRARENRTVAEVELMSSTSNEVCELWNGQGAVRTTGRPHVLQLIYFPACRDDKNMGLYTLEGAVHAELLTSEGGRSLNGTAPAVDDTKTLASHGSEGLRLQDHAPNMLINLGTPQNPGELFVWALVGVLIQSGVLCFVGVSVYHLKHKKEGELIGAYEYPLFTVGTAILALGMFFCASAVEVASEEREWTCGPKHPAGDFEIRLLWLQQRHVVSDQHFDATVVAARGKRKNITTSHPTRRETYAERARLRSGILSKYVQSTNWQELMVVVGVISGIVGFVLQFIGLRSLHWSASVAQLGAIGIMTAIRAWMRRGLLERPYTDSLIPGHDIDWLNLAMLQDPTLFWKDVDEGALHPGQQKSETRWTVITGRGSQQETSRILGGADAPSNDMERALEIRQQLRRIQTIRGPASELAASLGAAIEAVLNFIFPRSLTRKSGIPKLDHFVWFLNVSGNASEKNSRLVRFTVRRVEGLWETDAQRLEAALSLWLYDFRRGNPATVRQAGEHMERKPTTYPTLRLLGDRPIGTLYYLHLFDVVTPYGGPIVVTERVGCSTEQKGKGFIGIDRSLVTGCGGASYHSTPLKAPVDELRPIRIFEKFGSHLRTGLDYVHQAADSEYTVPGSLAIMDNGPLEQILARDMFSAFMWTVSYRMRAALNDTTAEVPGTSWGLLTSSSSPGSFFEKFLRRQVPVEALTATKQDANRGEARCDISEDEILSWRSTSGTRENFWAKLASAIELTNFMSYATAFTYIVPPVVCHNEQMDLYPLVELTEKKALYSFAQEVGDVQWPSFAVVKSYLGLFRYCMSVAKQDDGTIKAMALLFDALRHRMKALPSIAKPADSDRRTLQNAEIREVLSAAIDSGMTGLQCLRQFFMEVEFEGWETRELEELGEKDSSTGASFIVPATSRYAVSQQRDGEWAVDTSKLLYHSALHRAVRLKMETPVHDSTAYNADIFGWTPLHYACWLGLEDVLTEILTSTLRLDGGGRSPGRISKAWMTQETLDGLTPLDCAAKRNHEWTVRYLLSSGHLSGTAITTALKRACFPYQRNIVRLLIEAGADPSSTQGSPQGVSAMQLVAENNQATVEVEKHWRLYLQTHFRKSRPKAIAPQEAENLTGVGLHELSS